MQRIFDPFEQGNRPFEHRVGGLGLGLAISKSLAQAHGGSLTAQSDGSNRGSTFTLTMQALPQAEAASVVSKAVTDSARHEWPRRNVVGVADDRRSADLPISGWKWWRIEWRGRDAPL